MVEHSVSPRICENQRTLPFRSNPLTAIGCRSHTELDDKRTFASNMRNKTACCPRINQLSSPRTQWTLLWKWVILPCRTCSLYMTLLFANMATGEGNHRMRKRSMLAVAAAAISIASVIPAIAEDKPYDGVTLTLASQNDQFGTVMADLAPQFKEKTGDHRQGRHPELSGAADQGHRRFRRPHQGLRPRDDGQCLVRPVRRGRLHASTSPTGSSATPPRSTSTTSIRC